RPRRSPPPAPGPPDDGQPRRESWIVSRESRTIVPFDPRSTTPDNSPRLGLGPRPPVERARAGLAFDEGVRRAWLEPVVTGDVPARPADLGRDGGPLRHAPQAEVEPAVGGRKEAAAAEPPDDLGPARGRDPHLGADGVAVRGRPLQPEGHRPARRA